MPGSTSSARSWPGRKGTAGCWRGRGSPIVAAALGVATTGGALLYYAEWTAGPWFLITATLGWLLRAWVQDPLEATNAGAGGERALRGWSALVRLIGGQPWQSPALVQTQAVLEGEHVRTALRSLEQGVALADFRLSTWLYLPVQTLTLWDLHVWWALERWRRGTAVMSAAGSRRLAGRGPRRARDAGADEPDWAFPTLHDTPDAERVRIDATALGHPLLPDGSRVTNDVAIGPKGRFLLVTGSNMSGKSTLLRADRRQRGAGAGRRPRLRDGVMQLPLVALHTSMRVADSLERGCRCSWPRWCGSKQIVDAAREATRRRAPCCYLLDEVLQGTNSAERRIAVRTVVDHLLASWAIGVVTTHDLGSGARSGLRRARGQRAPAGDARRRGRCGDHDLRLPAAPRSGHRRQRAAAAPPVGPSVIRRAATSG